VSRARELELIERALRGRDGRVRLVDLLRPRAVRELEQLRLLRLGRGFGLGQRRARLVDGGARDQVALLELDAAVVVHLRVGLDRVRLREVRARGVDRLDPRAVRELEQLAFGLHQVAVRGRDPRVLPARILLEQRRSGFDAVALGHVPTQHRLRELRRDRDAVPFERADERRVPFLRARSY